MRCRLRSATRCWEVVLDSIQCGLEIAHRTLTPGSEDLDQAHPGGVPEHPEELRLEAGDRISHNSRIGSTSLNLQV
jgi:hypothetical protein